MNLTVKKMLVVAVAVIVAGVVAGQYSAYRDRRTNEAPPAGDGVVDVRTAMDGPIEGRAVVTGYVFLDQFTGDLLCSERTKADPPACEGVAATLEQLDPTRLDLVRNDEGVKGYDAWSRDRVVLQVRTRRATFLVEDVLPTPANG